MTLGDLKLTGHLRGGLYVFFTMKNIDWRTVDIKEFENIKEIDLLRSPKFGRKSLFKLKELLYEHGVILGYSKPNELHSRALLQLTAMFTAESLRKYGDIMPEPNEHVVANAKKWAMLVLDECVV